MTPARLPRRRGRPPASAQSRTALRAQILAGAARAYGRLGWHAVTVEDVLAEAGVSRPTYYRVFRDKHEAVCAVVAEANTGLLTALAEAIARPGTPMQKAEAAIDAYFDWGLAAGRVARSIYREIQLPDSPAHDERKRTLARILRLMGAAQGRSADHALLDLAVLHAVEQLGCTLFERPDASLRRRCRDAALTLVRCALARRRQDDGADR